MQWYHRAYERCLRSQALVKDIVEDREKYGSDPRLVTTDENLTNARKALESAKKDLRDAEEAVRREGGEIIPWPPDTTDSTTC